jgi:RNA polymerase sigma factor (sigma-70 family)
VPSARDFCLRLGPPLARHFESLPMDTLAACRPQVENLVARILRRRKDDPDVQDCTHETLRRALEHTERSLSDDSLLPWVLGIARHVALDALRSEYRRRARVASHTHEPRENTVQDELVSRLPDPALDPEALAANRQSVRHLDEALQSLPAQQRAALLALHVEGLGYREVAMRMGVPVATIGTWVLRARQTLLDALPNVGRTTQERTGH